MRRPRSYLLAFLLLLAACGGGGDGGDGSGGADGPSAALGVQIRWSVIAGAEGFVIHWGMESGVYPNALDVGMPPVENGAVAFVLEDLEEPGPYFFALTAYDGAGNESSFSNEIVVTIP